MSELLRPNPTPRVVPPIVGTAETGPGKIGHDLQSMIEQSQPVEFTQCEVVDTEAQLTRALLSISREVVGTGIVALDVKKDYLNSEFGVLTMATTRGRTVAVALNMLRHNSRKGLRQLVRGSLGTVFNWVSNGSIATVIADLDLWREFATRSGRGRAALRGVIDGQKVIKRALREQPVPGWEQATTDEELRALLSYQYMGKYVGPVHADVYKQTFPGVPMQPQRRRHILLDWPGTTSTSRRHLTLHQIDYLLTESRAMIMAVLDIIRVTVRPCELRQHSRRLASTMKRALCYSLDITTPRDNEETMDTNQVIEPTITEIDQWRERGRTERRRDVVIEFFGNLCPSARAPLVTPPGQDFRVELFAGLCLQCGQPCHPEGEECELSLRLSRGEVFESERNCTHCLAHDHLRAACPTLHSRCEDCLLLGHIAGICEFESVEFYLMQYMVNCSDGVFTRLERKGPLAGPFGFGLHAAVEMSSITARLLSDLQMVAEQQYQRATREELSRRERAVGLVIEQVPLINLYYLELKPEAGSWTDYFERYGFEISNGRGIGPYRGFSAPGLERFDHEPMVDELHRLPPTHAMDRSINEHDVHCEVQRIEARRGEARSILKQRRESVGSTSALEDEGPEVVGGARFSASAISELSDDDSASGSTTDDEQDRASDGTSGSSSGSGREIETTSETGGEEEDDGVLVADVIESPTRTPDDDLPSGERGSSSTDTVYSVPETPDVSGGDHDLPGSPDLFDPSPIVLSSDDDGGDDPDQEVPDREEAAQRMEYDSTEDLPEVSIEESEGGSAADMPLRVEIEPPVDDADVLLARQRQFEEQIAATLQAGLRSFAELGRGSRDDRGEVGSSSTSTRSGSGRPGRRRGRPRKIEATTRWRRGQTLRVSVGPQMEESERENDGVGPTRTRRGRARRDGP